MPHPPWNSQSKGRPAKAKSQPKEVKLAQRLQRELVQYREVLAITNNRTAADGERIAALENEIAGIQRDRAQAFQDAAELERKMADAQNDIQDLRRLLGALLGPAVNGEPPVLEATVDAVDACVETTAEEASEPEQDTKPKLRRRRSIAEEIIRARKEAKSKPVKRRKTEGFEILRRKGKALFHFLEPDMYQLDAH
ncbi:hypothetical protein OE88DRAFT_1644166 [Heliocybe sulcata]|uniref:Uncharacterized protein n=1 Tax=Heliocybe sulcata TaxID=5364 RepID=A0A5C3N5R0_9AGAM|nr:hypothetical protein OE88DRAFT_1644166 [Heliocybe sulcata]